MCWLNVSGIGARLKPRKLAQPTKEDAAVMNDKGLPAGKKVCVSCKVDSDLYWSLVAGPTCKRLSAPAPPYLLVGSASLGSHGELL